MLKNFATKARNLFGGKGLVVGVAATVAFTACVRVKEPATHPSPAVAGATLWKSPAALQRADLFYGPWGPERAPSPDVPYTLVERKHTGVNPGVTVRDPQGREWSVKQIPPGRLDTEAQVEVTLSRLLSAIGYYQAPVYFLPAFTLKDAWGSHTEIGGRFRAKGQTLKESGEWSWSENPFIATRPYQGPARSATNVQQHRFERQQQLDLRVQERWPYRALVCRSRSRFRAGRHPATWPV